MARKTRKRWMVRGPERVIHASAIRKLRYNNNELTLCGRRMNWMSVVIAEEKVDCKQCLKALAKMQAGQLSSTKPDAGTALKEQQAK